MELSLRRPRVLLFAGTSLLLLFLSFFTASLRAVPLCTPPSSVTITNIGLTDATVNWGAVIGITQYRVQYRLAPNGVWTNSGGVINGTNHTINGLAEATNYEARVGSRCSGNTYTYGAAVPFTTFGCTIPTNISVTSLTPTTAQVNWTLAPGVTDYRVQYRPASGGAWTTVPGGWQAGPSLTLTGLTAATDYEVRVGSRCGPGNVLYAPIFAFTSACPVPTGLTVSNVGKHLVDLSWNAVPNASAYWVRFKLHFNSSEWTYRRSIATFTTLTNLYPGKLYDAQIAADCGDSLFSAYSTIINFTTVYTDDVDFCGQKPSYNGPLPPGTTAVDRWGYPIDGPGATFKKPSGAMQAMTGPWGRTCGSFNLYFLEQYNQTGKGFDDPAASGLVSPYAPTKGEVRRDCACEVFTYLSSVINVPAGQEPDILLESFFDGNSQTLGLGSSFHKIALGPTCRRSAMEHKIINNIEDTDNGNLIPPVGSSVFSEFHGKLSLNWGDNINPKNYNNEYLNFGAYPGQFSLYSVMLHEAMHALGFAATFAFDAECSLGLGTTYSEFSKFVKKNPTPFLLQGANCAARNAGVTAADLVNDQLLYDGPSSTIDQPIYSAPPFNSGSSLSHFDKIRGGLDYIMRPSDTEFLTANLTNPEIKVLCDLNYTLKSPYTCADVAYINAQPDSKSFDVGTQAGPYCVSVLTNDVLVGSGSTNLTILTGSIDLSGVPPGWTIVPSADNKQICVTPPDGFEGCIYLSYIATNGAVQSQPASVEICITNDQCTFPNDCELVCNGNFESGVPIFFLYTGILLPGIQYCPSAIIDSWCTSRADPDIIVDANIFFGTLYSIRGSNVFQCQTGDPITLVHDEPNPNNKRMLRIQSNSGKSEGVKEKLRKPLLPTKTYKVSLWVKQCTPNTLRIAFSQNDPLVDSTPGDALNTYDDFHDITTSPTWTNVTFNYTNNTSNPLNWLIIQGAITPFSSENWMWIDDVSIVEDVPPLSIVKTVNNPNPKLGETITYTITITNTGTVDATNPIIIQDIINSNKLSVVTNSTFAGFPNYTIPTLAAGASQVLTVTAVVSGNYLDFSTDPTAQNCVYLTSGGCQANDVSACATITVTPVNVGIQKTIESIDAINKIVTYKVKIQNALTPANTATDISVMDIFTPNQTYVPNSISCIGCGAGSAIPIAPDKVKITLPSLTPGAFSEVTFQTIYTDCNFSNTAQLTAVNESDIILADNTATVSNTATVPAAPTVGNNGPLCEGQTLNLTASSVAGATYNWTGPLGFVSNAQNPSILNVTTAMAGTYTTTVTVNGCASLPATTTVTINPTPPAPTVLSNSPVCQESDLTLTASSTVSNVTYHWTGPDGFDSTDPSPTISPVGSLNAGDYIVTVTLNGCTSPPATINVVVKTLPNVAFAPSTPCTGGTLDLVGPDNMVSYVWSPGPGGWPGSTLQSPTIPNVTLADKGDYTLTVTGANGCMNSGTQPVNILTTPTVGSASSGSPFYCLGQSISLSATSPDVATYSWTGPNSFTSNVQNPTGITPPGIAGTYTYTVTVTGTIPGFNQGCVSASTPVVVEIRPNPTASISTDSPFCEGTNFQLFGGPPGVGYSWAGPLGFGSTLQNPTVSGAFLPPAGTHFYTLTTTLGGCTATVKSPVTILPVPVATANSNSPLCSGQTLNLTSGPAGQTCVWVGPPGCLSLANSETQNPFVPGVSTACSGVFTLYLTDAVTGCDALPVTTTVVVNPTPTVTLGSNSPVCAGQTLNLTATTIPGAAYSWVGPNSFTSNAQNPSISPVTTDASGTYTVTVTLNGCTFVEKITVTVLPSPVATANSNSPVCSGQTLNLTATTVPGATYMWTGPAGCLTNGAVQNPSIPNVSATCGGVYTLVVTSAANGCPSLPATTNVVVNPTPNATITFGSEGQSVCVGETWEAIATVDISPATYLWTAYDGSTSTAQSIIIPNIQISNGLIGVYYNVVVTVNGCTAAAGPVRPKVYEPIVINSITNNGPRCVGGAPISITTNVSGEFPAYQWTGPDNFSSTLQNLSIPATSTLSSGVYSLVVSNPGCSASATTTVVISAPPTASFTTNAPVCTGQTLNLTAANSVPGSVYTWTGPAGCIGAPNSQNQTIPGVTTACAGIYSLTVTTPGCPAAGFKTNVIVGLDPVTAVASNTGPACGEVTQIQLIASPAIEGAIYQWFFPNGNTSNLQNPIISLPPNVGGVYSLVITLNGCTSNVATTTVIKGWEIPPTVTSNSPICAGQTLQFTTNVAYPGVTYAWTGPNGPLPNVANPTINSATTANAGFYAVNCIDQNGCGYQVFTDVTIMSSPTSSASNNGPVCVGQTLQLTGGVPDGSTYSWTAPDGSVYAQQNPSIPAVTTDASGTYTLTVTNSCGTSTATTTVTVLNGTFAAVATNNGPVCLDQMNSVLQLFGNPTIPGATYSWTGPGGFTSNLQNPMVTTLEYANADGIYSLQISIGGCVSNIATTYAAVIWSTRPTVAYNSPLCAGQTLQFTTTVTPYNGVTYLWSGPNGFTSNQANPSISNVTTANAGLYFVSFMDENGCPWNLSIDVTVNPTQATATATSSGVVCVGQTLQLTGGPDNATSYSWAGPGFPVGSTLQNPSIPNVTTDASGTYTLTVTTTGCGTNTATTTVTVSNSTFTATATNNGPSCGEDSIQLYGSPTIPGATYSWAGPNGFISNLQNPIVAYNVNFSIAGTYSLTITAGGCVSNVATTNIIYANLANAVSFNTPLCIGQTLQFTNANMYPGVIYQWTGPNGFTSTLAEPTITNVSALNTGEYTIKYTFLSGCTYFFDINVVVSNATPAATASNNGPLCAGQILHLTGGPNGATYSWTGPNGFVSNLQSPSIPNISAGAFGTYTLTVNGCGTSTATTTLTQATLTATASNNGPLCTGQTLQLFGGPNGATYSWAGPNGFVSNAQNPTISNISASAFGTYTLTLSNGCGTSVATTTLTQAIVTATASSNSPVCIGQTLQLTGGPSGGTYSWTGPNGFVSNLQNPSTSGLVAGPSNVYTLVVTVGGCTSQATTNVVINSTPTANPTNNGPLCVGQTLNLTTNTVAGAAYAWTGPNSFGSSVQSPSIPNITANAAGTYTLVVTANGCTVQATTTLTVSASHTVNPTNNGPICAGQTLNLTTNTVAGAAYVWTGPNSFNANGQSPTIAAVTTDATGTYTVVVTVGTCTVQATTTVTIKPTPTALASSNSPVCTGQLIYLTAQTVLTASYAWTGPNSFSSSAQNPPGIFAASNTAGVYTLVVTVNGCTAQTTTTVVYNAVSPPTATASSNSPICAGQNLNLSAASVFSATYSWAGPNWPGSTQQNPSIPAVTTAAGGIYTLTVTRNGCTGQGFVTVTIKPLPTVTASNNGPLCSGQALNLTAVGNGTSYAWTGPLSYFNATQNPVINNINTAQAGTYSVTTTLNGCTSAVATTQVVVNARPAAPQATSNSPKCVGQAVQLQATSIPGASYQWTGPNNFTANQQNPIINSPTTANTGFYSVVATVNGCASLPGQTQVIINPIPNTPTVGNNGPICEGQNLTFTASFVSGAAYNWTGPAGFSSSFQNPIRTNVTTAHSGVYTLIITVNGCTAQTTTTVTVKPKPTAVASSNSPVCNGSIINLTAQTVLGASYNWTGPNGFNAPNEQNPTNFAAPANAGPYVLTVNLNGCTNQATTNVTVGGPTFSVIASANNPCVGQSLSLTATVPPGGGYSFSWTGPNGFTSNQQNPTIPNATAATSGTYSLTVTKSSCSVQATPVLVTVKPNPTVTASNNGPLCSGQPLQLTAVGNGTNYTWAGPGPHFFTSTQQNPTVINSVTITYGGTYSVTANLNGCTTSVTTTVSVSVFSAPNPTASSNTPVCEGQTLNLNTGIIAGATYSWAGPNGFTSNQRNPSISNVPIAASGVYTLTVTINNGCSVQRTTTVVIKPNPTASAASNSPVCIGNNILLTATTVTNAAYAWNGPGFTSTVQNPTLPAIAPAGTRVYNLTVTLDGCTAAASTTVVVNAGPEGTIISNGPLCVGQTLNMTAAVPGAVAYLWTGPTGFTSTAQNVTISNIQTQNAGVYSIITTAANGCTGLGVPNIIVYLPPTISLTKTDASGSNNDGSITVTAFTNGSPNFNYALTGPVNRPFQPSNIFNNLPAGNYTVTVRIAGLAGCQTTQNITINSVLGTPAITSITNVLTNRATIGWSSVSGAVTYNLRYRVVGSNTWIVITGIATNSRIITGLQNSTQYETQVQAQDGGGNVSAWSPIQLFTTATQTASCKTPGGAFSEILSASSATIHWNNVAGVNCYEIDYRISGPFTTVSVQPNQNPFTLTGLTAGQTYQYRIRSICSACGTTSNVSNYSSPTLTFTLPAFKESANGTPTPSDLNVKLYPNPNNGAFVIGLQSDKDQNVQFDVVNALGATVYQTQKEALHGLNEWQINPPNLAAGVYFLYVKTDDKRQNLKFIVR